MNAEQQKAYDLAINGVSLFITGAGGTGKTYLIKRITEELGKRGKRYQVCAPTGIAAVNVSGKTLHGFFGLKPWVRTIEQYNKFRRRNSPAKDLDVLIIDEISMVSAEMLDFVDAIMRVEKGWKNFVNKKKPFGGAQVLIFGDFFQLPPVIKGWSGNEEDKIYAFEADIWKEMALSQIQLNTIVRQSDTTFSSQLDKLRQGIVDSDVMMLLGEVSADSKDRPNCTVDSKSVRLECLNIDKDSVNENAFDKEKGEIHTYKCRYTGDSSLMKGCLAPDDLQLKIGCPVLHLANVRDIIYNGSTGVVVDPFPDLKVGRLGPLVHFADHLNPMEVTEHVWEVNDDSGNVLATKVQIPLILAYSISCHKSQGMTIDRLQVNLSKVFTTGQAYTALSRARTKEGLAVLGVRGKTKSHIISLFAPDKKVSNFYDLQNERFK